MATGTESSAVMAELEHALLASDRIAFRRMFLDARTAAPPVARVEQLIIPVLERIGAGWEAGTVSLAQVYMSGRLCEEVVDAILPPADPARTDFPPMAIAVLEDYHFLGLRLVYSSLRACGFSLANYGRCDADALIKRVIAENIRFLLISTLMLPAALRVRAVRDGLREAGTRCALWSAARRIALTRNSGRRWAPTR